MSWTRKCINLNCQGSQKLVTMSCGLTQKSKGNWWRCSSCGEDSPEFELEAGDFESKIIDEYIFVWVSNKTVATKKFTNLAELNDFMNNTLKEEREEYPLHVIRKSDFAIAEIQDVPKLERTKDNRYCYNF